MENRENSKKDIREDIISNIRHNDPMAGPMVLIPSRLSPKPQKKATSSHGP